MRGAAHGRPGAATAWPAVTCGDRMAGRLYGSWWRRHAATPCAGPTPSGDHMGCDSEGGPATAQGRRAHDRVDDPPMPCCAPRGIAPEAEADCSRCAEHTHTHTEVPWGRAAWGAKLRGAPKSVQERARARGRRRRGRPGSHLTPPRAAVARHARPARYARPEEGVGPGKRGHRDEPRGKGARARVHGCKSDRIGSAEKRRERSHASGGVGLGVAAKIPLRASKLTKTSTHTHTCDS